MTSATPNVRVGVAVFIRKDGKFLMQRRLGSHGAGSWSVPGGNLEFGESLEACARREVLEETNLQIKNIRFLTQTNDQFKDAAKHYLTIWMTSDCRLVPPPSWNRQNAARNAGAIFKASPSRCLSLAGRIFEPTNRPSSKPS